MAVLLRPSYLLINLTNIVMANGTSPTRKAIPIYTPPIPLIEVVAVTSYPESSLSVMTEYKTYGGWIEICMN